MHAAQPHCPGPRRQEQGPVLHRGRAPHTLGARRLDGHRDAPCRASPKARRQQRAVMAVTVGSSCSRSSMAVAVSGGEGRAESATAATGKPAERSRRRNSQNPKRRRRPTGTSPTATTGTPAPPSSPAAGATKLSLEADSGGQLAYNTKTLAAKAGTVTITMTNMSPVNTMSPSPKAARCSARRRPSRGHQDGDAAAETGDLHLLLLGAGPPPGGHGRHPDGQLVKLYICWGTFPTPRPGGHPCRNAALALQRAGHDPELVKSYGYAPLPGILQPDPRAARGRGADRQPLGADPRARRRDRDRRLARDRRVGERPPGVAVVAPNDRPQRPDHLLGVPVRTGRGAAHRERHDRRRRQHGYPEDDDDRHHTKRPLSRRRRPAALGRRGDRTASGRRGRISASPPRCPADARRRPRGPLARIAVPGAAGPER